MSEEAPLTAAEIVTLALVRGAIELGATESEVGLIMARACGHSLCELREVRGGPVYIRPERVILTEAVGPGKTRLHFDLGRSRCDPVMLVEGNIHSVRRMLAAALKPQSPQTATFKHGLNNSVATHEGEEGS